MLSILEINPEYATIIGIVLPFAFIFGFLIFNRFLKDGTNGSIRRYLSYLVNAPRIGLIKFNDRKDIQSFKREIKVRLGLVYLGIGLFLFSFLIAEFYEVLLDIQLPVTQGNTGDARVVSSLVFQSPFIAGWIGSMPWYGSFPLPLGWGTYHETWDWIFFTAAITDNPNFMGSVSTVMLLMSFLVGSVFLAPLISKRIRTSFLSSLFFLVTGMSVFTKIILGFLAHALTLFFGNAQIQIGELIVSGSMIPDLNEMVAWGLVFVAGLYLLYSAMGWKLWQLHYPDMKSRRWFLGFITTSYWLGFILMMLTV
ncbi:MAG: hypothetical protein ACFFE2_16730 [Candidatus Thorarchaeota archaeon]